MGKAIKTLADWKPGTNPLYVPKAIIAELLELHAGKQPKVAPPETDEQIMKKLIDRFHTMEEMVAATIAGKNHSLIISGPPGVGKSFITDKMFDEAAAKKGADAQDVHGYVRPTGLYKMFHMHRYPHSIVKFDDADSIFKDMVSLNILKAALDMKAKRRISWLAETKMEDDDGVRLERAFDFEGSVIFITNIDFEESIAGGSELSEHLKALMSRSHYLDLAMKTARDRFIRVREIIKAGGIIPNKADAKEILDFVEQHTDDFREMSLRMVIKLAQLKSISPTWKKLARSTLMASGVK